MGLLYLKPDLLPDVTIDLCVDWDFNESERVWYLTVTSALACELFRFLLNF